MSKFYQPGKPPFEYRHVLTGYEKSNQRSDNSILRITASLEQETGAAGSPFISGKSASGPDPIRTNSTESQNSSKVQEIQEYSEISDLYKIREQESSDKVPYLSRHNGHSRTSSGASGYSSSNASLNKADAILERDISVFEKFLKFSFSIVLKVKKIF